MSLMLYETLIVIATLLFKFTVVNMKGLNKSLNIKYIKQKNTKPKTACMFLQK